MTNTNRQLLSSNQIANYCGVNVRTVDQWLDSGRLRKLNTSSDRRVSVRDLLDFMLQNHLAIPQELMRYQQLEPKLPQVLVVDEHKGTADAIELILSSLSLQVTKVSNGFDATVSYIQKKPQLLTLDLGLDGMSGIEFIENIVATQSHRAKILVISDGMPSVIAKARAAGADAVIPKPIDSDTLKRSVRILLKL